MTALASKDALRLVRGTQQLFLLALRRLGGVPQRVHLGQRRLPRGLAARGERALDRGEAALELGVGRAQRRLRIGAEMAGEIDDREQEIADLFGQAIAFRFAPRKRALALLRPPADFLAPRTRAPPRH